MRTLFATNRRGRTWTFPLSDGVPVALQIERLGLDRGGFIVYYSPDVNAAELQRMHDFDSNGLNVNFIGWRVHYRSQGDELSGTPFADFADAQARRASLIGMGLADAATSFAAPVYTISSR